MAENVTCAGAKDPLRLPDEMERILISVRNAFEKNLMQMSMIRMDYD